MDFLRSALNAIPDAATHPFAFLSYLAMLLVWIVVSLRVKRNSNVLQSIHHLPEGDRLETLKV
jgi:hypothetical protein